MPVPSQSLAGWTPHNALPDLGLQQKYAASRRQPNRNSPAGRIGDDHAVRHRRGAVRGEQPTTTIDQVALAFKAPTNLPPAKVFGQALIAEL